jgi:hypothetical protein
VNTGKERRLHDAYGNEQSSNEQLIKESGAACATPDVFCQ